MYVLAIHPVVKLPFMPNIFVSMDMEAVLLVDADNVFNRLNRAMALHNIQYTCPAFATSIKNIHIVPSRLR